MNFSGIIVLNKARTECGPMFTALVIVSGKGCLCQVENKAQESNDETKCKE